MSEKRSYTVKEIQEILGISRPTVYKLLKRNEFSWIRLDGGKYFISKKSFEKFLTLQDKYKLDEINDYEEISMEENIVLAEHRRKKLKNKQHRADNGNLDYLTFDEAALLANVSRATIYEWSRKKYFPVIHVVKASRIPRKEFEQYIEKRKLEEGDEKNGINKRKKR